MQFSGSVEIDAPRDRVWAFVSDPELMGSCGPGVESVETIDETKFVAKAKVGVGPITARFTIDAEFLERVEPDRAKVSARGKAPGSAVDGTAEMTLRDGEGEGVTIMDWTADMQFGGMMASLGARLIEGTANKLIGQTFTCVKSKLETPADVARAPAPPKGEPEVPAVVAAEPQVPAIPEPLSAAQPAPRAVSRPLSVAFLPLAMAAFAVIALAMAVWTILAAG